MSFYPQPDKYRCGPFALKYSLIIHGIIKHEDEIGKIAGSTWWAGTDELGLAKAATRNKCKMVHFQSSNKDDARKVLNSYLKKNIPCLLCINNWGHWISVVNYSRGIYVIIDSEKDRVINTKSGSHLIREWKYRDEVDNIISFDGYAVIPKTKVFTKAKLTPSRAKLLMSKKNENLAKKWDSYFNDLISFTKPMNNNTTNYLTFKEFLRRNQESIVKKVADWHGIPSYSELNKILSNMKFISETYDLIISTSEEKKAIVDITALLMIYSCGKYGMDPIY